MSLLAAIAAESESLTFTRHAAGSYGADGIYTPGATSTFTAAFSVQPLNARDLQLLPAGAHASEALKLYGSTALYVGDSESQRLGDRFTRDGRVFEITGRMSWLPLDGGHYRYIATRVEG